MSTIRHHIKKKWKDSGNSPVRTATEMKPILEEKYQDLEVSERTVRRELFNLAWSREKKPVQPMVKHPLKVHVWGAINFKGKVSIHIFTENLVRHLYRKILNEQLYDNVDALVGG
ncbi:6967_t:CDS:2 [Entrophospora sp. SA101]|nr:6967_t:CDS:2 [Entrophospora sp. SA101]